MADFLFYPSFLKNLILIFLFTWKEKSKYLLSVSTSDNVCGPIAPYSLRFVLNIFDFFLQRCFLFISHLCPLIFHSSYWYIVILRKLKNAQYWYYVSSKICENEYELSILFWAICSFFIKLIVQIMW